MLFTSTSFNRNAKIKFFKCNKDINRFVGFLLESSSLRRSVTANKKQATENEFERPQKLLRNRQHSFGRSSKARNLTVKSPDSKFYGCFKKGMLIFL
ncbi:unnamed protein product [Rotaria socialis]